MHADDATKRRLQSEDLCMFIGMLVSHIVQTLTYSSFDSHCHWLEFLSFGVIVQLKHCLVRAEIIFNEAVQLMDLPLSKPFKNCDDLRFRDSNGKYCIKKYCRTRDHQPSGVLENTSPVKLVSVRDYNDTDSFLRGFNHNLKADDISKQSVQTSRPLTNNEDRYHRLVDCACDQGRITTSRPLSVHDAYSSCDNSVRELAYRQSNSNATNPTSIPTYNTSGLPTAVSKTLMQRTPMYAHTDGQERQISFEKPSSTRHRTMHSVENFTEANTVKSKQHCVSQDNVSSNRERSYHTDSQHIQYVNFADKRKLISTDEDNESMNFMQNNSFSRRCMYLPERKYHSGAVGEMGGGHISTSLPVLKPNPAMGRPPDDQPDMPLSPQYFKYSHLLVFPMHYLFKNEVSKTPQIVINDGNDVQSQTVHPIIDTKRVGQESSQNAPYSPGTTRLRDVVDGARGAARDEVNTSKSLESIANTSEDSERETPFSETTTGGLFRCYPKTQLPRRRSMRRLDGYDPYDPHRPVFKREVKLSEKSRTKSKSLTNLEWRVLKAFEPRAFQPTMKAWRSGIDILPDRSSSLEETFLARHASSEVALVQVACPYDTRTHKLTVQVLQLRRVSKHSPDKGARVRLHLVLLPGKRQKLHTRHLPTDQHTTIVVNESLVFKDVLPDDVMLMGVRCRLYITSKYVRRRRLLLERLVPLRDVDTRRQTALWLALLPPMSEPSVTNAMDLTDAPSTTHHSLTQVAHLRQNVTQWRVNASSPDSATRLLLAMRYSSVSGTLVVEAVKGSHFWKGNTARVLDTFVRLEMYNSSVGALSSAQLTGRGQTSLKKAQPNPLFKESFVFQVPLYQSNEFTLMVSVISRSGVRRHRLLGHVSLGARCRHSSGRHHWHEVVADRDGHCTGDTPVYRWHFID